MSAVAGDARSWDSSACSIARTMAVLGEPWTVLVVRDLFLGVRRFDDLVGHLGIARTVLTRRLGALVDAGVVETREYRDPGHRPRREYALTPAGRDLRPVLLALVAWGDAHRAGPEGPPMVARHAGDCEESLHLDAVCAAGHRLGPDARVRLEPGPGARPRGGG